jgi:hypothetical protein
MPVDPASSKQSDRPDWTELDKTCPACRFENHKMALFCKQCGYELGRSAQGEEGSPTLVSGPGSGVVAPDTAGLQDFDHSSIGPTPAKRASPRAFIALAVIFAIMAATFAFLALRTNTEGSALALAFRPGQTNPYHITMRLNATLRAGGVTQPLDFTSRQDVSWQILSVDAKGTATVEVTGSDAALTTNGQTQTIPIPSRTFLLTADGRLISDGTTVFAGLPDASLLSGGEEMSAILPGYAVRPGQQWSKTVSLSVFGSPVSYQVVSRYLRNGRVGSVEAAVVRSTATFPMNLAVALARAGTAFGLEGNVPSDAVLRESGRMSVRTTSWIDLKTKELLETTSVSDMALRVVVSGVKAAKRIPQIALDGTLTMTLERT